MNMVGAIVRGLLAVLALISATVISAISLFLLVTLAQTPAPAYAQTPCGSIIEEYDGEVYETPIEDCNNPFGVVNLNPALQVNFGDILLESGSEYEVLYETRTFTISGTNPVVFDYGYELYRHENTNYRKIMIDSFGSNYTFEEPGTYSLVVYENEKPQVSSNFLKRIIASLIPTAHASPGASLVLTFEVVAPEEPTGISNILFIPGMKGSRLYMNDGGDEKRLWEPLGSQDYEDIRMTDTGESVNDIYTRDVIDSIYAGGIGGDVYASFLEFLNGIDGENGPLVQIFPYDWRYSVSELLENGTMYETGLYKKLVETVNYLAVLSKTGKVTIIAHSNGGHVTKALMTRLEELGKANQVDKIIFIATPHTGTPKAIAALLHGYDEEWKLNIPSDARDIRAVIKNMPGPHGLLPSEAYAGSFTEPFISFDDSTSTKLYRDRYGSTIDSMSEYKDFLNGVEGRVEMPENISSPTKVNSAHLDASLEYHKDVLDNWEAPEGVEVFNVVGTGLKTPREIQYREFVQDYCGSPVCVFKKVEPVVQFTLEGDETVVTKSSKSVQSDSQLYINLSAEEEHEHANITEAESVQILVDRIIHGSSTDDINYISVTQPTVSNEIIKVERIHSPARIYIEDDEGRRTGRDSANQEWKEEIPGTNYYEIGGVKYVLIPGSLSHKVIIEGEGSGLFTHVVDELVGEEQTTLHTLVASVTPATRVSYTYTDGTTSPVSVDQNGDGTTDYQMTIDGGLIDTRANYAELRTAIRNLSLPRLKEVALLAIVSQAEQFYKKRSDPKYGKTYERLEEGALYLLDQTLIQLRKAKLITTESYQGVKSIIDKLIKQ